MDVWLPVLKVLLLQEVIGEHGEPPAVFTRNGDIALNSLGAASDGWIVLLPTGLTDQGDQEFPGTNRCESRIVAHLLTLRMSGGTLAKLSFGKGSFIVFKVVNMLCVPCLFWSVCHLGIF